MLLDVKCECGILKFLKATKQRPWLLLDSLRWLDPIKTVKLHILYLLLVVGVFHLIKCKLYWAFIKKCKIVTISSATG